MPGQLWAMPLCRLCLPPQQPCTWRSWIAGWVTGGRGGVGGTLTHKIREDRRACDGGGWWSEGRMGQQKIGLCLSFLEAHGTENGIGILLSFSSPPPISLSLSLNSIKTYFFKCQTFLMAT